MLWNDQDCAGKVKEITYFILLRNNGNLSLGGSCAGLYPARKSVMHEQKRCMIFVLHATLPLSVHHLRWALPCHHPPYPLAKLEMRRLSSYRVWNLLKDQVGWLIYKKERSR